MAQKRGFFGKVDAWRLRVYPERQLFLRSEGRVRFLTISSPVQIFLSLSALAMLGWASVASVHFFTRDLVLEAKQEEISAISENYQTLAVDFSALEAEIERRADRLEERQKFLEGLVGPNFSEASDQLNPASVEVPESVGNSEDPKESSRGEQPSSGQKTSDASPYFILDGLLPSFEEEVAEPTGLERRSSLMARLTQIEESQRSYASALLALKQAAVAHIDDKLAPLNTSSDAFAALNVERLATAAGGPYIPAEGFEPIFNVGDHSPFNELYKTWLKYEAAMETVFTLPLGEPAADYYLSSRFGRRRDPFRKRWANHPGVDLAGWPGTAILATAPGTVVRAEFYGPYGNMVEIDHGNGYRTRFGHMRKLRVEKGARVEMGTRIGDMGKTGRATDTHLHYEVWLGGELQDPLPYIKANADVFEIKAASRTGR